MLFILTNSADATVSYLTPILERSGIPFLRLDTDRLIPRIALAYRPGYPTIKIDGKWYTPENVSHIWYRRPEKLADERFSDTPEGSYARSEWTEFLECFFAHVPRNKWVNHPACNARASRKLEQLTRAVRLGFTVPETLVTQDKVDLQAFYERQNGRMIVKPLASGYIERPKEQTDSLIYTNQISSRDMANLGDLACCPTLFQQFVPKSSDIRITILDGDVHAVELLAKEASGEQRCDIRRDNMSDVIYRRVSLPEIVERQLREMMNHYDLRFAAIDMAIATTGEWYFFEINANGQWAWLDITGQTHLNTE